MVTKLIGHAKTRDVMLASVSAACIRCRIADGKITMLRRADELHCVVSTRGVVAGVTEDRQC